MGTTGYDVVYKLSTLSWPAFSIELQDCFVFVSDQAGRPPCPLDPFFIMPDKCKCVDFQVLKLQESPDAVPNGEMPRHMQLYCDR